MKNVNSSIENEIISLKAEIAQCEQMTEQEVMETFNTDSKEEYLEVLREELAFYNKEYEENEIDDDDFNPVDCGFADMQDYINYKYF